MSDLLVRDIDPKTLAGLKQRAARHGRSLQREVRRILDEVAAEEPTSDNFWEWAREMRKLTAGTYQTDSAELIREDRDSNYGHPV